MISRRQGGGDGAHCTYIEEADDAQAFETVSQLFSLMVPEKMAYSQLFLNLRGKIPPENHCFRPVFELRYSLIRRAALLTKMVL
jgi:hypothetical protein